MQVSGDISSMNSKSIAISHNNTGNIKYMVILLKSMELFREEEQVMVEYLLSFQILKLVCKLKDLLTSGSYADLTVDQTMKRWSNNGYGANIYPEIADKKMKDLTDQN